MVESPRLARCHESSVGGFPSGRPSAVAPVRFAHNTRSALPADCLDAAVFHEHGDRSTTAGRLSQTLERQNVSLDVVFDELIALPFEMVTQLGCISTTEASAKFDLSERPVHSPDPTQRASDAKRSVMT